MRPLTWLGAYSRGGLALPDASPSPCRFYAPRGVFCSDDTLAVADTGNHRVLLWHGVPSCDGQPADVVLGQGDFYSEGPKCGGLSTRNGMYLPTAIGIWEGHLFVADAWHHRILVWNEVPRASSTPPDYAIGQSTLEDVEPNRGGGPSRTSLWCPYGMTWTGNAFYICDTGNRRILGWRDLPLDGRGPDWLIGQPDWDNNEENRGEGAGPRSFRWPHAIVRMGDWVYIADAGNHRVLGWQGELTEDRDADCLLGQPDFASTFEFAHRKQGAGRVRFPYALAAQPGALLAADTANNRILFWPLDARGALMSQEAVVVAGQPDFDSNGENRWLAVTRETFCWPYGVCWHGETVAVADSGNNRVMLWQASGADIPGNARQPMVVAQGETLCV